MSKTQVVFDEVHAASTPSPLFRVLIMVNASWDNAVTAYAVGLGVVLRERGHAVHFVVKPGSPGENALKRRGITSYTTLNLKQGSPSRVLYNYRMLKRIMRVFQPDVVDVFYSVDHVYASMALRGLTVPLIRTRGGPREPNGHIFNRLLYKNTAAAHVACADFIPRAHYQSLDIDDELINCIRPGFDIDEFKEGAPTQTTAREELGIARDVPLVGLIARLTKTKGHKLLLEAVAKLQHNVELLFTGIEYDLLFEDLRLIIDRLGLKRRVHFYPGKLQDVRVALKAVDVLAIPSTDSEAISRTAIEGLALGIPVVASRLNSLPEIVGDAGLLVPPGNVEELAGAVARMLSDETLRERVKREGPQRIQRRYNRVRQVELTEELFGRVLALRV